MFIVLLLNTVLPVLPQESPTFTTQSRLVIVPVTVADKNGGRIYNLQQSDFVLLDSGKERKITVEPWGTYESRISLVVVIETSFLSEAALVKIRRMASSLSDITGENGEIAVITADSQVNSLLDFTTQWDPLQEAFERLHASTERAGHVLDGLSAGVVLLAHRPQNHRRVILLLCEGHDRGSHVQPMEVLTHAEKENVIIYTASYSPFLTAFTVKGSEMPPPPAKPIQPPLPKRSPELPPEQSVAVIDAAPAFEEIGRSLKQNIGRSLAEYTGGRELNFAKEKTLQDDLGELSVELHSQYQISFPAPEDQSPVYHEIEVRVKNHPDAVIRARPGYWIGAAINGEPKPQPN
jgi:VWFA-related protein